MSPCSNTGAASLGQLLNLCLLSFFAVLLYLFSLTNNLFVGDTLRLAKYPIPHQTCLL